MLPVSLTPLVVEQKVGSGELLDLSCLTSGQNSDLTFGDIVDLRRQGITVGDDNYPVPWKTQDEMPQPEYF